MRKKLALASGLILLISVLCATADVHETKASDTVRIRADGSIDPPTAPISTEDNMTYTFGSDISDSVVVEKGDIVIIGEGRAVQGPGINDSVGLSLVGLVNVTVVNVTIRGFHIGLLISCSSDVRLLRSSIFSNSVGVQIDAGSVNNTLRSNEITECTIGIEIRNQSASNVLHGNRVKENDQSAVYLEQAANCTFIGNVFSGNDNGIEIASSDSVNNTFLYNDFLFNSVHVLSPSDTGNLWDSGYPLGGNFWDDYVGKDEFSGPNQDEPGSDGIGDTSYSIDEIQQYNDAYPLMGGIMRIPNVTVANSIVQFVGCSTNSTMTSFDFDSQRNLLVINTTIEEQLFGFCKAAVSKSFLNSTSQGLAVTVNGQRVPFSRTDSATCVSIYFVYSHSLPETSAPIPIIYIGGVLIAFVAFFFIILRMKRIGSLGRDEEEETETTQSQET